MCFPLVVHSPRSSSYFVWRAFVGSQFSHAWALPVALVRSRTWSVDASVVCHNPGAMLCHMLIIARQSVLCKLCLHAVVPVYCAPFTLHCIAVIVVMGSLL